MFQNPTAIVARGNFISWKFTVPVLPGDTKSICLTIFVSFEVVVVIVVVVVVVVVLHH